MISLSPPAKVARVHKGLVKLGKYFIDKKVKRENIDNQQKIVQQCLFSFVKWYFLYQS